jgi:hypothetical protein
MNKRYRVLKERFVAPDCVLVAPGRRQSRASEFVKGDEFEARPSTLLRRAVRDKDIELVEAEAAIPNGKRGQQQRAKDAKDEQ